MAAPSQKPPQENVQKVPKDHIAYSWGKQKNKYKQSRWFKGSQMFFGLMPIPIGCYLLYKAIKSFNRNPPPIATDSATVRWMLDPRPQRTRRAHSRTGSV